MVPFHLGAGFDILSDDSGFVMVQQLPLEDAAIVYVQNSLSEFERQDTKVLNTAISSTLGWPPTAKPPRLRASKCWLAGSPPDWLPLKTNKGARS
jgi:hypothetical protein